MKKYLLTALFAVLYSLSFSQTTQFDVNTISTSPNTISFVRDMSFANESVGYIIGVYLVYENNNYVNDKYYIFKTTNGGVSWTKKWDNNGNLFPYNSPRASISFVNPSVGYFNIGLYSYKTTNGGDSWQALSTNNMTNIDNVISFYQTDNYALTNIGYLIKKYNSNVYKYNSSNQQFELNNTFSGISLTDVEVSRINPDYIYVCGYKYYSTNDYRPYLAKSTNGGQGWLPILNGSSVYDGVDKLYKLSVVSIYNSDIVKVSGNNGLLEYNTYENALSKKCSWGYYNLISFGDNSNGFYLKYDAGGANDDPEENMTAASELYVTTDGGATWTIDYSMNTTGYFLRTSNKFFTHGKIAYITKSGSPDATFLGRKLSENFYTKIDNISTSGSFTLNSSTINTPSSNNIRGGVMNAQTNSSLNNGQSIFYRWSNYGSYQNSDSYYNLLLDNDVTTYYKTKSVSNSLDAISNISNETKSSPPTRGIKDTIISNNPTIIHSIHESMGGIFYTRSTDDGANFSQEEVVDYTTTPEFLQNKNSYLNVLRLYGSLNPITATDQYNNAVVAWERYNPASQKVEISMSRRFRDPYLYNIEWKRYTDERSNPIFKMFSAASDFKSYPKIFAIAINVNEDVKNTILYIPHLEPYSTNQKKLVVSASAYYNGFVKQDFELDNGNISDVSVTGIKNGFGGYVLYFAYVKDNNIIYRKEIFNYQTGYPFDRNSYPDVTTISSNDGQLTRITPDISLRNGRPIVTYRATSIIQKIVIVPSGEDFALSYMNYPIFVKYKYLNASNQEVWSTPIIYNSAGVEQKNPNVEGCKNGYAFVLNYNYNNQYRQVAQLQTGTGYCVPGQYTVNDAKLVRGSFYGTNYPHSSPMLLTLTQSASLYNIGKQTFSVSNIPSISTVQDNLVGIIREENTNYNFNLGPVIAKNTNVAFATETETSITNPVEFSNTMVSAPFSLGPNDTLILGGNGFYNYISENPFLQKRFTVNLMRNSTQGIYMTLYSDSIGVTDTIETEYLRGYVFSEGEMPEVDSFYVQLFIDSTSLYQGDQNYAISNAYSPDELFEGDGPNSYKSKVHFVKGNHLNNISNIPKEYSLSQNYPNPFNPVTNIKYQIPLNGFVSLKIYDITGREIANLVKEYKQAGYYTISFNGSNFASGVYFYRIQTGDFVQVKKMVLIK